MRYRVNHTASWLTFCTLAITSLLGLPQRAQATSLSVNHCLQASCKTYLQIDAPVPFSQASGSLQLAKGTLVPDQLGQTWILGQNITLRWHLPDGLSVVYPLQYTDSFQNAYQASASGCSAGQASSTVCCSSTSYSLAHNDTSLDKYSLGSPSQAFQGTFTVSTSAGATATLTNDPFQAPLAASASFVASLKLPSYFPVLPATSSAVLVNNGNPEDSGTLVPAAYFATPGQDMGNQLGMSAAAWQSCFGCSTPSKNCVGVAGGSPWDQLSAFPEMQSAFGAGCTCSLLDDLAFTFFNADTGAASQESFYCSCTGTLTLSVQLAVVPFGITAVLPQALANVTDAYAMITLHTASLVQAKASVGVANIGTLPGTFTLAPDTCCFQFLTGLNCSTTWAATPPSITLDDGLASTFQAEIDLPGEPLSGGCQYVLALDGQNQSTVFVPLQVALLPSPPPPPPPPHPPGSPIFSSPADVAVAFTLTFPSGDFSTVASASNQAIFSYSLQAAMAAAAQVAITDVTIQSVTAGSIIVAASVAFPGSYSTDAAGAFASQLTEDMSSILTDSYWSAFGASAASGVTTAIVPPKSPPPAASGSFVPPSPTNPTPPPPSTQVSLSCQAGAVPNCTSGEVLVAPCACQCPSGAVCDTSDSSSAYTLSYWALGGLLITGFLFCVAGLYVPSLLRRCCVSRGSVFQRRLRHHSTKAEQVAGAEEHSSLKSGEEVAVKLEETTGGQTGLLYQNPDSDWDLELMSEADVGAAIEKPPDAKGLDTKPSPKGQLNPMYEGGAEKPSKPTKL